MHSNTIGDQIKSLRQSGLGYKTIAVHLGVSRDRVRDYCRKVGLTGFRANDRTNPEKALDNFLSRFEQKFGHSLTYISGYNGSDSNVNVRCNSCNHEYKLNAQSVRKDKVHECPNCVAIEREQNERQRLGQKVVTILRRRLTRLRGCAVEGCGESVLARDWCNRHYTSWLNYGCPEFVDTPIDAECASCSSAFKSDRRDRVYCSTKCANRESNRRKEIRRRNRLRKNGRVDYTITLSRVMRRDRGKCQLCNGKVDSNADPNDGAYPSIDHIIPVSKGGTHTWGNVQLAHRSCNRDKSDEIPDEVQPELVM